MGKAGSAHFARADCSQREQFYHQLQLSRGWRRDGVAKWVTGLVRSGFRKADCFSKQNETSED
jgi:hypothetical protein